MILNMYIKNEWNRRMSRISHIGFVIFFISVWTDSFSQLQVTPNNNATALATTLAGPGVTINGATMNCPASAGANPAGTFVGTASNIGITGGVLLTSGDIKNAIGPNIQSSITTSNGVTFNDPDLLKIDPNAFYDVCILEFNAVPSCSTLAFTFAFGSDEYPEFVNSTFNDAFGIFVTGPNPSGPAYSGYNMALIPSTTIPVAINNVNNGTTCPATGGPCMQCAYYVDNCTGTTIEYDGFTKPINVTLAVKPCNSYHFKLAIADAGDMAFDSGVFFAMQSLACNPLPVLVGTTSTPSACTANNGSASATPTGGTPPYTYSWNTTPPQLTQTATGLPPGNYTVTIVDATGCFSNTGTVTVAGSGGFSTTETHVDVTCFGSNNGSATVTPNGTSTPYTYLWSTTPAQATQTISNIPAGTYTCTVTDKWGCVQTQTVTITQPPSIVAVITNTVMVSCPFGTDGSATASGSGGASPYNYSWNSVPVQAGAVATNLVAGNYIVTVSDANGCTTTASVSITQPPAMNLPTSSTMASCGMTDGSATVNPSGGAAPYTYLWLTSPSVQTTPTATNIGTGTYSVIVTDSKGCLQTVSVFVPGGAPPVADFYFSPDVVSLLDPTVIFIDASGGIISSWGWDFGDAHSGANDTSNLQNPMHAYSDTGYYCITLTIANATGLCKDTVTKCLKVEAPNTFYIPNTFTPNHDGNNEIFMGYGTYIAEFHMWIFDRWGNLIFESNDINKGWNGTVNNKGDKLVQEDVYVWKVKLTDTNKNPHSYIGHVNMIK
jgi:gliding motility-associated-like protein